MARAEYSIRATLAISPNDSSVGVAPVTTCASRAGRGDAHPVVQRGGDAVAIETAFDRHGGGLVGSRAQRDVAVAHRNAVGGIEAAPSRVRQQHFRPGMQMTIAVRGFGMGLITADETG